MRGGSRAITLLGIVSLTLSASCLPATGEETRIAKPHDGEILKSLDQESQKVSTSNFLTDRDLLALAEAAVGSSSSSGKKEYLQQGSEFLTGTFDDELEGSGDFLEDTKYLQASSKGGKVRKPSSKVIKDDEEEEEEDYYYLTPNGQDLNTNRTDNDEYYFEDDYDLKIPVKGDHKQVSASAEVNTTKRLPETKEDDDLLYEYHNEMEEEDYELSLQKNIIESGVAPMGDPEVPLGQPKGTPEAPVPTVPPTVTVPSNTDIIPALEEALSSSHLLLMVASALVSFLLFTVAFAICCCYRNRQKGAVLGKVSGFKDGSRGSVVPFVIDARTVSSYRSSAPPASSIVKSYQKVPHSTKEFLSGMENTNHRPHFQESEKPLLP